MFNLGGHGVAIVGRLGAVDALGTVALMDRKSQSNNYSVEMPSALVVLEKVGPNPGKVKSVKAEATWAVIARGRALEGEAGVLSMLDEIVDALHGFHSGDGGGFLSFLGIEYFKDEAESVSYTVRFSSSLVGQAINKPCSS